ncbi:glycoside-pentoside-hexuronide (GPH):cation symporter [uncultured Clostridium sp.]|uniref:glycoside-pentoside-hexuronide (GPH):cation symporter n=1 Tax=uncultured Clostridium sp. TaxID=59620 RepID=UPI0028E7C71C|nr:glycoside-pentoside-hexuronide (GPH):cation symporter [uncultured Clostridium sp.]
MESNVSKSTVQKEKLTLKEKIAYGMGDLGNGFLFDVGQTYLLKFYTDALGLPPVAAGSIFLVSKIWDAFADIGIGTWVDSRKKFGARGKFRAFILYAALPLALATIASFTNPHLSVDGNLIWAYLTYMIFGSVYSMSNIPYGSMAPAMTRDTNDRAQLASFRQAGSNMALLLTTVGFMPIVLLFSNQSTGYLSAVGFFAVLGVLCQLFCYANIKERYVAEKPKDSKVKLSTSYKSILKNAPLLILCIVNLFTFSAFNVKQGVQVYYCQYVLKQVYILPYMGFFSIGCVFLAVALVPFTLKRLDKKHTYMIGCAIWAVGDILAYLFANNAIAFILFACLAYFGSGFVNSLNWVLISDAVEYGEWKTGNRSEGIVYSFFTFFRKLSQAIAGFIPGIVLAWVGYVPNAEQSTTALMGIRGLMFIYPGVLLIATIIVMGIFYKLSNKKYENMMKELNERKGIASV